QPAHHRLDRLRVLEAALLFERGEGVIDDVADVRDTLVIPALHILAAQLLDAHGPAPSAYMSEFHRSDSYPGIDQMRLRRSSVASSVGVLSAEPRPFVTARDRLPRGRYRG